mgnify:CR=1 FL=1
MPRPIARPVFLFALFMYSPTLAAAQAAQPIVTNGSLPPISSQFGVIGAVGAVGILAIILGNGDSETTSSTSGTGSTSGSN